MQTTVITVTGCKLLRCRRMTCNAYGTCLRTDLNWSFAMTLQALTISRNCSVDSCPTFPISHLHYRTDRANSTMKAHQTGIQPRELLIHRRCGLALMADAVKRFKLVVVLQ